MIRPAEFEPSEPDYHGLIQEVDAIFSEEGLLSRARNFEYRAQQQAMARAVAESLVHGEHLIVEAGTGVGKSLAYLIPSILYAIQAGKRAVISTHTINLQEQLVEKDLPMLKTVLPVDFSFTMLKGRQNYLCTRRLEKAIRMADGLFTTPESAELQRLLEWSQTTSDGSLSDLEPAPLPKVWSQVCSERGLCSPKACGPKSDFAQSSPSCFFQKARQRILSADVLVLNHTLFFTLLNTVEEPSEGGVLFKNDFVVFDEAHTMEAVASRHIGLSVSSGQLSFALNKLWNPNSQKGLLSLLKKGKIVEQVSQLHDASDHFFKEVEATCDSLNKATEAEPPGGRPLAWKGNQAWKELRIRRPDLVEDSLSLPLQRLRSSLSDLIQSTEDREVAMELQECQRKLGDLKEALTLFLTQEYHPYVYWVDRGGRTGQNLGLHAAPVDVAPFLRHRLFESGTSIVMTSATLSVMGMRSGEHPKAEGVPSSSSDGMSYFVSKVGAEGLRTMQQGSPFDFQAQTKCYVVSKMPDPRHEDYRAALEKWIEHFVTMTSGGTFVLFTNLRLLQEVAESMLGFFESQSCTLYVQGSGLPRSTMLERFKKDRHAVLFGADSFWQGVDVPGDALRSVIITRLPFQVPDHPLVEARLERIAARGGDGFTESSLPEAILKFRQGVGRLIRTRQDQGVIAVLDNRVLVKRYGQRFLDALPEAPLQII